MLLGQCWPCPAKDIPLRANERQPEAARTEGAAPAAMLGEEASEDFQMDAEPSAA